MREIAIQFPSHGERDCLVKERECSGLHCSVIESNCSVLLYKDSAWLQRETIPGLPSYRETRVSKCKVQKQFFLEITFDCVYGALDPLYKGSEEKT